MTRSMALLLGILINALSTNAQSVAPVSTEFQLPHKEKRNATEDVIRAFEAAPVESYVLDNGDEIVVDVWGRPELSAKHVIGPDGKITLPLVGVLRIAGETREEAQDTIRKALSSYYEGLAVTVKVDKYASFRVLILGRVGVPGALAFDTQPTLLDVLTRAAGLPIGGIGAEKAALVRCAIIRGRDKVIWVDLKPLLSQGRLDLNIRLARNDVVYLPDADDRLVYVLGYVKNPGAYHLSPNMAFMDALSLAGGPTEDAGQAHISLVRSSTNSQQEISLKEMIAGNANRNFSLEEGDIIYVPPRGMARVGYVLQKMSPLSGFAVIGSLITR